ncbi:11716_t:CDS:1, partial [Funneliformis geosporum]
IEAIFHKDYKEDRFTIVFQVKKYQIYLELLRNYIPITDIDNSK